MRAFAALFLFEFGRRRMLLLAGAMLGILACVLPSFGSGNLPSDVRFAAALVFGLSIFGLGALLIGTSFLAEDLGSNRLSFYFSAPVGGLSIFATRLAGAAAVVVLSSLLTLIPPLLVQALFEGSAPATSAGELIAGAGTQQALGILRDILSVGLAVSGSALLLLAAGNALGLAGRARDAWIVLETLSILALAGSLFVSRELFANLRSEMFNEYVLPAALVLLGVGLLLAAAMQVLAGRTDMPRARAAFALSTAAAALAIGSLTIAYSRSYAFPDLSDFDLSNLVRTHSYDDRWIEVRVAEEFAEDLYVAFLIDRQTGRSVRLGAQAHYWQSDRPDSLQWTADGRYGLWMKPSVAARTHRLLRVNLGSAELLPVPTGLEVTGSLLDWKLSADGTLVATASRVETGARGFGVWDYSSVLQISVERADGSGALLSRRVAAEVKDSLLVTEVSATALRLIAQASGPLREVDDAQTVPWTTTSETCAQPRFGFLGAHESPEIRRNLLEIEVSLADSTTRIRRRMVPDAWWDATLLSSPGSNILLASQSGSVALLDRETSELLWCHSGSPDGYFSNSRDVAFTVPGRRFAIWSGPRSERSLLIVDDSGMLVASSDLRGDDSRFTGVRPGGIAIASTESIELLGVSNRSNSYVIRKIELPSGNPAATTRRRNERLDRTSLLFPAHHQ